jgi:hypothetical protein
MSKQTDRREAERAARKLAYQQSRQQAPATAAIANTAAAAAPAEPGLLQRAQAFFHQPVAAPTAKPMPQPISQAQLAANRANAQLSTGATTPEGSAISARNNTRHGLTSDADGENYQVLASENQSDYNQSLADYRKEWKPATATENDLVNRLIMHRWLRRRALRLQQSLFDPQTSEVSDVKKFELYRRYETTHERSYNKCLGDLQRLRALQLREQNGFESQRRKNEEHQLKMQSLRDKQAPKTKAKPTANPLAAPENVVPDRTQAHQTA